MFLFLIKRLVRMAACLVAVSILTFALLQAAPGSFADIQRELSGSSASTGASVSAQADFTERYGSQVPTWRQYLIFMRGAATLNMGPTYEFPQLTVQGIIFKAFGVTAMLALLAVLLALLLAIPLGVLSALRRNTASDYGIMFVLTGLVSLPNYLMGLVLIIVLSVLLHLLPTGGWTGPENLIMPVLALAFASAGILARYIRSSMIETLREDYVLAAYAKGGRPSAVIVRHALRNSLLPLVTVTGPLLASLLTGTVFVETIFQIPGLGLYFANAARVRDMPLLMGATLFFALILMTMNLVVDLTYRILDPRIRYQKGG
ncbi:MAG TPA: ABC transporter permease [Streptosporangiaceae bacterium]|nr:ABC transporter permease [Streptosporangiaceae bacterium]